MHQRRVQSEKWMKVISPWKSIVWNSARGRHELHIVCQVLLLKVEIWVGRKNYCKVNVVKGYGKKYCKCHEINPPHSRGFSFFLAKGVRLQSSIFNIFHGNTVKVLSEGVGLYQGFCIENKCWELWQLSQKAKFLPSRSKFKKGIVVSG